MAGSTFFLGSNKMASAGFDMDDGMRGGLVCRLDETDYQRNVLSAKGIIGVMVEYHANRDILVGMHISGVFEMLAPAGPPCHQSCRS